MRNIRRGSIALMGLVFLHLAGCASTPESTDMPAIPVSFDAIRQWDRWPYQRLGARAYMRSTYDRAGGNETADASHFLYQEADDFNVTLDVEGRGVLYFVRTNHWHGSPWHYEVDGVDHIVRETTTANPNKKLEHSVFIPEDIFPNPLTWTYAITKGADLMWRPIPFEQSLRLAYARTFYGTGYYIYHLYASDAPLSQPIESFDGKTPPDQDVLELIRKAGTDIAPKEIPTLASSVRLSGAEPLLWCRIDQAPSMIRALKLTLPREHAIDLGRMWIRITWDDRDEASIHAPLALFFGAGTLYNRDDREYLVKAFPVNIRYDKDNVHLACYFPMPFFKSARMEFTHVPDNLRTTIDYEVRYEDFTDPPNHASYFHATYRDHPDLQPGHDVFLLDTRETEGGGDWSGMFVGTSFIFSHRAFLPTLEGDPRFLFDDARTPQAYGTGTEEWGGGGDYWGGRNMTLPFAGHPTGCTKPETARDPEDLIQSAYRFLLSDLMPFGKRAVIRLEHGGTNDSHEHYETVTYWYGLPSPSLVLTDEFNVGVAEHEKQHHYHSPQASDVESVTSIYELGVDKVGDTVIYEPETEIGRHTSGTSEFTLELDPENLGVLLRRTLDYRFPNQRAEIFVAPANDEGEVTGAWKPAGIWYLAGSNTCYHSYAANELGAPRPVVQTSNRYLRDDEFLLARSLTRGRDRIRVRITFTPVKRPLLPGMDIPELAWSELRYKAYCYRLPEDPVAAAGPAGD